MSDKLEIFASAAAAGTAPVDPAEIFQDTLSEISGTVPVIYDEDIKERYIEKLSGEIAGKMPDAGDLPLPDFYNYAVFSMRPVKMGGTGTGVSYVGVPSQFGEMASAAGASPKAVETLAKVARSGESVSENGITAERVNPIGPTPQNGALKKMFMTAALMASMTINALIGPYAQAAQAQDLMPAAGGQEVAMINPSQNEDRIRMKASDGKTIRIIIGEDESSPQKLMLKNMMDAKSFTAIEGRREAEMEILKKSVADPFFSEKNPEWTKLKGQCAGKPEKEQLQIINSYWNNKIGYMEDSVLRGKADYWATPSESLSTGLTPEIRQRIASMPNPRFIGKNVKTLSMGDCEDYAIAKFATAWNLGLGDDINMKIMIVRDQAQRDMPHAILAFQGEKGLFFLDSQSAKIQTQDSLKGRYSPAQALNTQRCWNTSGPAKGTLTADYKTAAKAKESAALAKAKAITRKMFGHNTDDLRARKPSNLDIEMQRRSGHGGYRSVGTASRPGM